jgi:two-component system, NtrC family, nitrogen regulation response regulator NtrX
MTPVTNARPASRYPPFGSTVIWVGSSPEDRAQVEAVVGGLGLTVQWATGTSQALAELREGAQALCLLDCRSTEALRVARSIRTERPQACLVGVIDPGRPESNLDAFRAGVFDVLPWPIVPWDLSAIISNAQDLLQLVDGESDPGRVQVSPYGVFGSSPAMRKIVEVLPRVAPSRCAILLYGERGTGREMIARAIHGHSRRPEAPFVTVDCSHATPQDLEHELFGLISQRRVDGHEERRTMERISRNSRLVEASGGTLFLQNLVEMPTRVQAKLQRVLRDREAVLASDRTRLELDVRPMAAVEPGFEAAVEEGRLRRDLYDRLSLIRLELPPLRQRREDIPFVANHFLKSICRASGVPIKTLTRPALTLLAALPWRGNAPELRALLERLVLLTPHGSIRLEDVLAQVRLDGSEVASVGGTTLREARLRFERDYIAAVVRQHHGRMGDAAKALGIQRTNLYRKLRQLNVAKGGPESRPVSTRRQSAASETQTGRGRLTRSNG